MEGHAPHLAALARLNTLLLMSPEGEQTNPVCASPGYRAAVFAAASSLDTLDGVARNAPNPPLPRNTDTNWSSLKAAGGRLVGRRVEGRSYEDGGSCGEQQERGSSWRRSEQKTPNHDGCSFAPQSSHNSGIPGESERTGRRAGSGDGGKGEHATGRRSGVSGKGEGGRAGLPPPEEVVPAMPRFDEVAGRFLQRRLRGDYPNGDSGVVSGSGSDESDPSVTMSAAAGMFVGGRGQGDSTRQHGLRGVATDGTQAAESGGSGGCDVGTMHPEDTTTRTAAESSESRAARRDGVPASREDRKITERDRKSNARGDGNGGQGNEDEESVYSPGAEAGRGDEHGEEDQGLLSRLRSVAHEARLEVMESRLQKLHVSILPHKVATPDATVLPLLAYARNMHLSSTWFDDRDLHVLFEPVRLLELVQRSPARGPDAPRK